MPETDRILIVDDGIFNCELLEGFLRKAGYETQSVYSGAQALQMLSSGISLILLDITMPGMTGFEVLQRVRRDPDHWDLPIIMVTGLTDHSNRLRAAELGASDFIAKPVDSAELQIRVAALLKMKHARDAERRSKVDLERKIAERTKALQSAHERLEAVSVTDPTTGLPNHLACIAALDTQIAVTDANGTTCAAMILDIDAFKNINDEHGYIVGDAVLSEFGPVIQPALRNGDFLGRWGGEEFLVLLPDTDGETALAVGEDIRSRLVSHAFEAADGARLACSVGAAIYPLHASTRQDLLTSADRAMYTAKRLGGNQTRSADDPALAVLSQFESMQETAMLEREVEALATLVSARDSYTGHHTDNVAELSRRIAGAMGMSGEDIHLIGLVGQLHDIGKIAIPDSVLRKPDGLTEEEWLVMRTHTVVGADVAGRMPKLWKIARAIRAHHERWDGTGYPDALLGEDIPLASRIVAVADTFEAIISDRPYRKARTIAWAIDELRRCAGAQFDPKVVQIAESVICGMYGELEQAA